MPTSASQHRSSPDDLLRRARDQTGAIVFLTGAGISAESGIPTFRGPEGYWQVGSRNYRPTELATAAAFSQMPEEIWSWYLYRRSVCLAAQPNPAHLALVEAERRLTSRFLLVTQNVDGLHLRAGNNRERTYEIHGNIDWCRCVAGCPPATRPIVGFGTWNRGRRLSQAEAAELRCGTCAAWLRPHVLWFDESYDEPLFRFESALAAARHAAAVIVIGTSGATTLPALMCEIVAERGAPLIVVDPNDTPFGALAAQSPAGAVIRATATAAVPNLCSTLV